MNKDIILKAENISKQYRLGQVGTGTSVMTWTVGKIPYMERENPYLKIKEIGINRSTKGRKIMYGPYKTLIWGGAILVGMEGKNGG
jgi:lipopolysaccharide transport system ATP-binding protein